MPVECLQWVESGRSAECPQWVESGHFKPYRFGVDFAAILIFPFSALVAFITVAAAAVAGRVRPRLIWPFAFSSLVAVLVLFSLPAAGSEVGFWLFIISMVVLWSTAIGTVIGALLARAAIAVIRRIRSR